MSHTYRRQHERHEYSWVLRESTFESGHLQHFQLDRHSPEGRRAIARFHSDAYLTLRSGPPRWFRRIFKRRQSTVNARQYFRWVADPGYNPIMSVRHRHSAKWAWW
jgi:hypothetical protein